MADHDRFNLNDPAQSFAARIIDWSGRHRFFVLLGALALAVAGTIAIFKTPLDAIPDLTDTQIIIRTDWPGQAPQIIEDQVTFPLSSQMLGLPKTQDVRGFSMFGSSFVYVVFEDDVDLYWARTRVLESLSEITAELPPNAKPQLGPDATGVGWIFQYALTDPSGEHDLEQLRTLQDWFVRFELAAVDGVSEVASVGGFVKEFQVRVDPNQLQAHGLNLAQVIEAVREANQETGGRTLEMAETEYLIRSFGYIDSPQDLAESVITVKADQPITVGDVARVVEGPAQRRGITELNGQGEAVGGIVVMRPGANALAVIDSVKDRLDQVRQGLPDGVELDIVYDRSQLIEGSVAYLRDKLIEESLVVVLVVFLFLLHARSALVAIITLPLGILAAFIVMNAQGITANIMSLGGIAIAIGSMVDASIVMIENAHKKLAELGDQAPREDKQAAITAAAKEVGPGLFFSLLIITVSFLPIFALTGQADRLFSPLAYTKTYAMAAASILSVTVIPVLMLWLVRGKIRKEEDNPINRFFSMLYRPVLNLALRFQKITLAVGVVALISMVVPISKLGSEFMPPLYEGGILYMPMTLPGASPATMREVLQVTNRQLMSFPEVEHVFGKAGRADTATDPAPLAMVETWVELKPRDQWREGMTPEQLIDEMDAEVRLPGMMNSWGYPIKIRMDMLSTGIRTPIGVKVTGPELSGIDEIVRQVEHLASDVPGTRSAIADRVQGAKYIHIIPDRRAIARQGLRVGDVQTVIQTALGGVAIGEAVEGRQRSALTVRYDRPFRDHLSDIEQVVLFGADNQPVSLGAVADIQVADGPAVIKSENARLAGFVFVDTEGRDLGSYIADLEQALTSLDLPSGYALKLSGQFEQMELANQRLSIAVPATFLIILSLLYLHFQRWDRAVIVLLSLPFALVGAFWMVWLAGYNLSVAVAVGLIALAGIAAETAIIMLLYIDQAMRERPPSTEGQLLDNVKQGAVRRLRPKLMTAGTIILGLIPIFITQGPGSDVMRRIALPMVSGMVTTLVLTLVLIPVVYAFYMQLRYRLPKSG